MTRQQAKAVVEKLIQDYPTPTKLQSSEQFIANQKTTYCVGGALCLSKKDEFLKQRVPPNAYHMAFPISCEISEAVYFYDPTLKKYKYKMWAYTGAIIRHNDNKRVDLAWQAVEDLLCLGDTSDQTGSAEQG